MPEPETEPEILSTLSLNDVQATIGVTDAGKFVLEWTDYVAGDWSEEFDTIDVAYARLAVLLACREANWTCGFAHKTETFAPWARAFLSNSITA